PLGLDGTYNNLDLHFGHEQHRVLGATIDLGMTALTAEALDVGDRHALHAQSAQSLANFLELEGLDDGGHELHVQPLLLAAAMARRANNGPQQGGTQGDLPDHMGTPEATVFM